MCMCAFRNVAKELFSAHALCNSIHGQVNLLYIECYILNHSLQSRATLCRKAVSTHLRNESLALAKGLFSSCDCLLLQASSKDAALRLLAEV